MGVTFLLVKSEKSRAVIKSEVKNRADAVWGLLLHYWETGTV